MGLSAYEGLPALDQTLHGVHFMMCAFAVLVACIPLLTQKGSAEHKFSGLIYLPLSLGALGLASFMAWREASVLLFCFNAFCAYLLLSGWRAVHEKETPKLIDWLIPICLLILGFCTTIYALVQNDGRSSLYLFVFAFNAFYLSWRDLRHLSRRARIRKHRQFFGAFDIVHAAEWINRHVAGMVGSLMANMSVVVLTLLPLSLHWLWPASLITLAGIIAFKQRRRKAAVNKVVAKVFHPQFRTGVVRHRNDDDISKAA
jgi:hypothetical protein